MGSHLLASPNNQDTQDLDSTQDFDESKAPLSIAYEVATNSVYTASAAESLCQLDSVLGSVVADLPVGPCNQLTVFP